MALAKISTHKQAIIDVHGHKLFALAFNYPLKTTPIIFIHGFGSSVGFWTDWQTPYVQENFRWYSLSLPGHTPATFPDTFPPQDINAENLATIMIDAIKKLVGNQQVVLIGHSTGGFIALNIAMHAPELVKAVVSVSGFVQGKWTGSLGIAQQWARWGQFGRMLWMGNEWLCKTSRAYFNTMFDMYAADVNAMHAMPAYDDIIEPQHKDFLERDSSALFTWLQGVQDIDIRAGLSTISAPTLIMVGEDDPIVPAEQARIIHEGVPNSDYVSYSGAGHMIMWERHEQYHRDLTAWLKKTL